MHKRNLSVLLSLALLVAMLAACTAVQAPSTTGGSATPAASTSAEATPADTATEAATPAADEAEATGSPEATEEAVPEAESGSADAIAVEPVNAAECEAIQAAISEQLSVELVVATEDFSSEIANRQGTSCTISATGTGEEFSNFVDVAQSIREVFEAEGWTENQAYIADGPTGTASGFEMEDKLALVNVDWSPSEDADCPDDQPISTCELEPSQQIYTVMIELVQGS